MCKLQLTGACEASEEPEHQERGADPTADKAAQEWGHLGAVITQVSEGKESLSFKVRKVYSAAL